MLYHERRADLSVRADLVEATQPHQRFLVGLEERIHLIIDAQIRAGLTHLVGDSLGERQLAGVVVDIVVDSLCQSASR